jgi:integrase
MIGIPGLHPHSLRHSYAVAALRAGMDVKTLQNNLGHASASVTLDVYAKYTDDAGAAAARLLSAYFSSALQN